MNINIVNKKTHRAEPCDVYVGRPSALGNPYPVTMGREECIRAFRREFMQLMMTSKDTTNLVYTHVNLELMHIQNVHKKYGKVNLVCWCAPLACHAAVIVEYFIQMDIAMEAKEQADMDLLTSGIIQPEDI